MISNNLEIVNDKADVETIEKQVKKNSIFI